ncbi:hypothetical protein [Pontibacter sp. SGAir0037]|nr:hypothetical protein [Pontibacter sp. SGAir0037]
MLEIRYGIKQKEEAMPTAALPSDRNKYKPEYLFLLADIYGNFKEVY